MYWSCPVFAQYTCIFNGFPDRKCENSDKNNNIYLKLYSRLHVRFMTKTMLYLIVVNYSSVLY